jgi:hypothetical protein
MHNTSAASAPAARAIAISAFVLIMPPLPLVAIVVSSCSLSKA